MENDINIPPTLNKISKIDLKNFYYLFANIKESKKLLESFKKYTNDYFEAVNFYYKQLTEINCHFLVEDKFKTSFIKTPIFLLGKAIKRILEVQIDNLFSIIDDSKIFDTFKDSILNLEKILTESSVKFDKKFLRNNAEKLSNDLGNQYYQVEAFLIDNYISEKYNKHVEGIGDETLKERLEQVKFLEDTFLTFQENTKSNYLDNLKLMENKAVNLLNEMKFMINNILETLYIKEKKYLEILEKETNVIREMEKKASENSEDNNADESTLIEKELDLKNIIDLDIYKYTVKIIENPSIKIGDRKKKKKKEEKNHKDKNKQNTSNNTKKPSNELILTKEDIYNIVSKFYGYNFKMINKSIYNLDTEKEKLETTNLSEKLLSFDIEKNITETITDDEVRKLFDLLNKNENLKKFFMFLNNYRITSKYELTERVFNIIKKIFYKAQDYLLEKNEKNLEGLIIILSQTFYLKEGDKKVYLQEVIKDHSLFKRESFWKNHIEEIIKEELEKIERDEKEGRIAYTKETKEKKKKEIIITKLLPFSTYMKEFGADKTMILNLINPIMDQYNFDENSRNISLSMLNQN